MPLTEQITWVPITERLPDAESNVLLGLARGDSCEGFLDGEDSEGKLVWRDVCAIQLRQEVVTHWADMPKGPSC